MPGLKWRISFIEHDDREVVWQGEFSKISKWNKKGEVLAELLTEQFMVGQSILLAKGNGKTTFEQQSLPVMDKHKSNLFILRDDSRFHQIYIALGAPAVILNDRESHVNNRSTFDFDIMHHDYLIDVYKDSHLTSINELHNLIPSLDARLKLLLVAQIDQQTFETLTFVYTSIFPSVSAIKLIQNVETEDATVVSLNISLAMRDGKVISQSDISSGMFKTLMLLADLMLSGENTVLLIDELENSIGVNCLPDILKEIKSAPFQVIVTTHHPKIINDIPPKHWKVVHRKGHEILIDDANEIAESNSHHDPYIQLINSGLYINGQGQ